MAARSASSSPDRASRKNADRRRVHGTGRREAGTADSRRALRHYRGVRNPDSNIGHGWRVLISRRDHYGGCQFPFRFEQFQALAAPCQADVLSLTISNG